MNNKDYWARRFKIMEDALKDQANDYVENLEKQFNAAIRDIETQMRAWYQRFAVNNNITLAEAKRMLTTTELKEFLWTVQEYIEKGREMGLSGAWIKELENASARVHISRLDALKYQLRQQAEALAQARVTATTNASSLAYTQSYYHTAFEVQRGLGVGWTMQALNEDAVKKVLSRPWTVDSQTFTARCWTDKTKLVETVNQELTQMLARGAAPDKAIAAIAKQFNTSKSNAGRVVMTESAYFASAAQKDCFNELDVEQYRVVGTLDTHTCDICGDMDGRVYKMSDYVVGSTAPPFHPWCRCCTAPYFADMEGIGERYARDAETGERYKVPKDMTYKEWKAKQDEAHGAGFVDKKRKIVYNTSADTKQFKDYKARLGDKAPKSFADFQKLKYDNPDGYAALKTAYADKGIQSRLLSNPQYTTLKTGQQGKHILGHNNYTEGRSYLAVSMDEAQELIKKYAGTGQLKRDGSGKWTHKEFVTADKVIGYILPPDGGDPIPTKRFSISYAVGKNKGAHIVPAREV